MKTNGSPDVIIGSTGFVGSSLLKQIKFNEFYNSENIGDICYKNFNIVICAGVSAKKWLANLKPNEDKYNIDLLKNKINTISARKFILISTVDVFDKPINVNENSEVKIENLHSYGKHRRDLEIFVKNKFKSHLIVRLPGLVGKNLRKNAIYDFKNNNQINKIDSRGIYQFYPIKYLWSDIKKALNLKINLIHLTAEPICIADIAKSCFGINHHNITVKEPVNYDFRSNYSEMMSLNKNYHYNREDVLGVIKEYSQNQK